MPGITTSTLYEASGNAREIAFANGVTTAYGYSPERGWLNSILTQSATAVLQDLSYTRDPEGRIGRLASAVATETWDYGYDDLHRLTSAANVADPAAGRSFEYDSINNLTFNSAVGSYQYPLPGQPRPHAVTQAGALAYGYDGNGSMIDRSGEIIDYDGEHRPVAMAGAAFVYGPDGARLKKIIGGLETLYLGDDYEIAPDGTVTKYLPGGAKRAGAETFWLHRDHLDSVHVWRTGVRLALLHY